MANLVGKTILHFKIIEQVGQGGMGVVYRAHDVILERDVALKFLPTQYTSDREIVERFKREAKAAAALNHPNIITVYEVGEHEGQTFIAMEYVKGESLRDRMKEDLSSSQAIELISQVCEGLGKAHKADIVHRDIKPENIMIDEDGRVRILDFGLAKLRNVSKLTKTATTLGTLNYMSPEQLQGLEIDQRTDIWSIGVVFCEMLAGLHPFQSDNEGAVVYSILNEEPEPMTGDVPIELERIVSKAMGKKADDRYQYVDEMRVDLRSIRKALESGNTHAASTKSRFSKRRHMFSKLKSTSTKGSILTAGFIIAVLLTIVAAFVFNHSESDPVAIEKSIAVLAFTDMSPRKDQEYFCDGMAEEVMNALAQIPGLKVSARTSAFQFKGRENDIQTIGEKLGVGTVLEGSVRKSGSKLRVTAQLINVADGFHIWSHTYERELTDVFTIQDDLSRSIVQALEVELSGYETKTLTKRKPTNVEAYNLYLKGRYFWNRRTEEGLKKSIDYFHQVIDLEPTYALAYAGLADAYTMLGNWQYLEPKEAYPKAKAAAEKAVEIDDLLAEAHTALAISKFEYDWDWHGAESESRRAIGLNPNYATAHHWYAFFLAIRGRHDEARAEIEKALQLDPLSLIINAVSGRLYQWAQQDDKAITQCRKTLEMDSEFIPAHDYIFGSYFRKGMVDESFKHFLVAYSAYYDLTSKEKETLQTSYKESGWNGAAHFMIAKHKIISKEKYVSPIFMSIFHAILKDHDQALAYLKKAYEIGSPIMIRIKSPEFEALHSKLRFQAFLKKVGLE